MSIRDIIPWNRSSEISRSRDAEMSPFLALHREMNRMFDDVFRHFDMAPIGRDFVSDRFVSPMIDVDETAKAIRVTAELPGLDEKDIKIEVADNVLSIAGEKKTESDDRDRLVSERYYGRFERRIPLNGVDEEKIEASFRNGVLTVTLPKSDKPRENVRTIAINNNS